MGSPFKIQRRPTTAFPDTRIDESLETETSAGGEIDVDNNEISIRGLQLGGSAAFHKRGKSELLVAPSSGQKKSRKRVKTAVRRSRLNEAE